MERFSIISIQHSVNLSESEKKNKKQFQMHGGGGNKNLVSLIEKHFALGNSFLAQCGRNFVFSKQAFFLVPITFCILLQHNKFPH